MTKRKSFILFMARVLRVKLYNHWSEIPQDENSSDECSSPDCHRKAYVNMGGVPFCSMCEERIRSSRIVTGQTGPVMMNEMCQGK